MRRHAADGLFSPRCDTFGQTVRVASRASFPGCNGLIAFGLSPVAANEVTALPTVERRIVRKDIRDGRTRSDKISAGGCEGSRSDREEDRGPRAWVQDVAVAQVILRLAKAYAHLAAEPPRARAAS
jgi:hypothetical protein